LYKMAIVKEIRIKGSRESPWAVNDKLLNA
jgi:hypothetical protein